MATSPDTRKTVLITGAGVGGIGGELAKEFQAKGYRVFAAYRRIETVAPLAALGIETVELDVTSPLSIAAAHATISALTNGKLSVLVNNAGQGTPRPCTDLDVEGVVKETFDVNVFGVMRVVQAFVDLLIADGAATVVNIGSIAPIIPLVFGGAYNASKAAMHAYADCLRMELKPFNVKVLTIITGGVRSSIVRSANTQLPENSLYTPINDYWLQRVELSQACPMDTAVYAKSVVARIIRGGSKPLFWDGYYSWSAWAIQTFLWKGFTDYSMSEVFGLIKLAKIEAEKRKQKGIKRA